MASDPTHGPLLGAVSNGTLLVKEGSLTARWVREAAEASTASQIAVASDPSHGPLLGLLRSDETVLLKGKSLPAGWTVAAIAVTQLAVAG